MSQENTLVEDSVAKVHDTNQEFGKIFSEIKNMARENSYNYRIIKKAIRSN
jgi:hypothetical protein